MLLIDDLIDSAARNTQRNDGRFGGDVQVGATSSGAKIGDRCRLAYAVLDVVRRAANAQRVRHVQVGAPREAHAKGAVDERLDRLGSGHVQRVGAFDVQRPFRPWMGLSL